MTHERAEAAAAPEITCGDAFGSALAEHFGRRRVLDVKVNNGRHEVFSATLTVAITPQDLEAIAKRMGVRR